MAPTTVPLGVVTVTTSPLTCIRYSGGRNWLKLSTRLRWSAKRSVTLLITPGVSSLHAAISENERGGASDAELDGFLDILLGFESLHDFHK